ncbi:outer membrane protein assembly factor BamD [Testudinibacter sp. P27/CKL/0425]
MYKLKSLALLLVTAFAVTACSSGDKQVENLPVEDLYSKANTYLLDENYSEAIRYLDAVDSRYPFGAYAEQAQLGLIYANYKDSEYTLALANAERFLRLHSNSQHLDFVLYLAGLINTELGDHFMQRTFGIDRALRDPLTLTNALHNFETLQQHFPNSQYAADAAVRANYLRSALARHEQRVAEFYFKRNAYVATVNRVLGLLDTYPDSEATHNALPLLEKSYLAMNLKEPAAKIAELIKQGEGKTFAEVPVPAGDLELTVPNVLAPNAAQ